MKALLLKDYYTLSKSFKTILIIILAYGIFGIISGQITFLSSVLALVCATIPISSFSYDDFAKWDTYALSMPLSRKTIVLEKYVLGFLLAFLGSVISLLFGLISLFINDGGSEQFIELATSVGVMMSICILMLSVVIPIIIKLGVEKGRMAMLSVLFIPAILIVLVAKATPSFIPSGEQLESLILLAAKLAPVLLILIFVASYFLSLKIYGSKEF